MELNMSESEMLARIAELEAEIAAGKAHRPGLKVSPKGGVSIYGLGRFPVTLYASQWEALFAKRSEIEGFIEAHRGELATKK